MSEGSLFASVILVGYLAVCLVIAVLADTRGRSGFLWALISFVVSPMIALAVVLWLPRVNKR